MIACVTAHDIGAFIAFLIGFLSFVGWIIYAITQLVRDDGKGWW